MQRATHAVLARIAGAGGPEHPGSAQPRDINRGWCADWARLVCAAVPGAVMVEWDDPQSGMLHTYVHLAGRYYDAECPDGAADVTGLPCFQRPSPRPPAPEAGLETG